ncbi:MAG: hypothetical protein Q8K58_06075 [Acidimicrobiales bacterium]|nr:hypothetical protein [Acidimicrobiales bacterium]
MTPEPPEPTEPERPTAPVATGSVSRPPRILVSVEDLENPADWDVVVVENDAVDDATALRIARQRAGRPVQTGTNLSLPSLDERDVARALETDHDAEDVAGLSVDAFSPPALAQPPRRRVGAAVVPPLLEDDGFDDLARDIGAGSPPPAPAAVPKPGVVPEVAYEEPPERAAPTDDAAAFERIDATVRPRHMAPPDAVLDQSDDESDGAAEAPAAGDRFAEDLAARADAQDEEHGDEQDEALTGPVAVVGGAAAAGLVGATAQTGIAVPPGDGLRIAAERATTDVPTPDDPDADGAAGATMAPVDVDLWGRGTGGEIVGPGPAPALTSFRHEAEPDQVEAELEAELDEQMEDALLIDSSFPLGPEDVMADGAGASIDVSSLDYASVFGPVQGALAEPELDAHRPRRAAAVADARMYGAAAAAGAGTAAGAATAAAAPVDGHHLGEGVEDDDASGLDPAPKRRRRGRRALVALGLAAGVLGLIGLGTQLIDDSERPSLVASEDETTSSTSTTIRRTRSTSDTTTAAVPVTEAVVPVETTTGEAVTDTTARRRTSTTVARRTTTTVRRATATTRAPSTTAPPPPPTTQPPPPPPTTQPPPPPTTQPPPVVE